MTILFDTHAVLLPYARTVWVEGWRFLFSDNRDIGALGNLQNLKITPQKKG